MHNLKKRKYFRYLLE